MCGEIITLQNIKGIGDKISEKILNSVGGEEELQKIIDNVDVEKIANIEGISQRKAIEIIKKSGGVSSLAHLNQTGKSDDELYKILTDMKSAGLDAIEGYYTEYSDEMAEKYRQMASKTGLKLTGGSDFHGENKDGYNIGTGKGNLRIPYTLLKNLFEQ